MRTAYLILCPVFFLGCGSGLYTQATQQSSNNTSPQSYTLIADANQAQVTFLKGVTSCASASGFSQNDPTPSSTYFPITDYFPLASAQGNCSTGGNCLMTECQVTSAASTLQILYVTWDIPSWSYSNTSSFTFTWQGQSGHYSGNCNGNSAGLTTDPAVPVNVPQIQVYEAATTSWVGLQNTSSAYSAFTVSPQGPLQNYLVPNAGASNLAGQIYTRIISDLSGVVGGCVSIQTDFMSLQVWY